ncbi:MAG: hypothetical protein KA312_01635 [Sphingorhabdus sp.]|nr:hypothetical protein [Sphingorhabdus sp.]
MRFQVDAALVHRMLDMRFGGMSKFADSWAKTDSATSGSLRSAKTIYGWLQNGVPSTKDTLHAFCGALDVDPVSLVNFDHPDFRKNFGRLRRSFLLGGLTAGGYRPLYEVFHPSRTWPPNGLSRRFHGRDWTAFRFEHAAETVSNCYAAINIKGDDSVPREWPRAFHIAYRRKQNVDGLWRPYGSVVSRFGEAILIHENGNMQRMTLADEPTHSLSFHTYFGPSPVEFTVTSLHPFAGSISIGENPDSSLYFVG